MNPYDHGLDAFLQARDLDNLEILVPEGSPFLFPPDLHSAEEWDAKEVCVHGRFHVGVGRT